LLQGHVDERGLGDMGYSIVGSDGIERTHKRISERQIKTLFGTINIKRIGYSNRGNHGLFPTDSLLNLPDTLYSFCVQKLVAQEAIRGSFDEGIERKNNWGQSQIIYAINHLLPMVIILLIIFLVISINY
jgi:hypothetical protein